MDRAGEQAKEKWEKKLADYTLKIGRERAQKEYDDLMQAATAHKAYSQQRKEEATTACKEQAEKDLKQHQDGLASLKAVQTEMKRDHEFLKA
jgi:hypothetical protein